MITPRYRVLTSIAPWALCALFSAATLPGQENTGSVTGVVADSADAVVPAAAVSLTGVDQGITKTVRTNERGIYKFDFVTAGHYEVSVVHPGFKKIVERNLVLAVGQTMRVDLRLEVGETTQSLEVVSQTQNLQLESSQVSQVISGTQVADLPLNGRNFNDLIGLNAGVTDGGQRASNSGYNLNGSRTDQNMFLIDGQTNANMQNNLLLKPALESIGEFQIQTATFSAEYGRTGGGIVSLQLKSGTNQFHGSLFEFLRNDKLDANNFFDNEVPLAAGQTKASRAPLKRNQFGGSVGGPVIKDKLFFFFDYQGTREVVSHSTIQSVPTPLERLGDFSKTLMPNQILYQNSLVGSTFTGQTIPISQLDPVAVKLANLYPLPNLPGTLIPGQGTINNFSTSASGSDNGDQFDIKLDYQISNKDSVSGHYNRGKDTTVTPAAFGKLGPCVGCGVVLDLLAGSPQATTQGAGITETHLFSAAMVNQFRVGVTRLHSFFQTSDGGQNLAEQIGLKNVNVSPLTTGLPWFDFSPSPSWIGTSPFTPEVEGYSDWQVSDAFSYLKGRHGLKFGYEMHRRADNGSGNFFGKGAYIFVPFFTGNAFADFMTGRPLVIEQDLTPGTTGLRGQDYGMFIQDDFKVTHRLTLNIGLRYDIFPGFYEEYNRISNLNPLTGTVALAGLNGAPRQFVNTNFKNFGPRFGFAYALNAAGTMVIRGGYGISYSNSNNMTSYAGLNPPYTKAFNLTNLSGTTADAIYKIADGLPTQLAVDPAHYDPTKPAGTFRQIDPNSPTPYTQSFSLNIQRLLPGNIVAEVGFVGTKGTHLPGEIQGDPTPPGDPKTVQQRTIYYATIPNVTGITYYINGFSSVYDSLQAKLEKRFSHGLQGLVTYTYSKSIDNKSGSAVTGGSDSNPSSLPMDPFNISLDRGLSSFDRRNRFVAAFNYNLPIGRSQAIGGNWNAATDAILGGWQVNGILTLSSGLPFNVFATSSAKCGCTAGELRPNRIKDGRLPSSQQSPNHWFDATAFTDPAPGTYGNAGRNIIPGPGLANMDFSLFKKFSFGESRSLQFRAEFFNLFNHANFLYPTSTANATWNSGGILTAALPARIGQVALKFTF